MVKHIYKIFPEFEFKSRKLTKGKRIYKLLRFESNIRFEREGVWYDQLVCDHWEVDCDNNEEKEVMKCAERFLRYCYMHILFSEVVKNPTDKRFVMNPSHNQMSEKERLKLDPTTGG